MPKHSTTPRPTTPIDQLAPKTPAEPPLLVTATLIDPTALKATTTTNKILHKYTRLATRGEERDFGDNVYEETTVFRDGSTKETSYQA